MNMFAVKGRIFTLTDFFSFLKITKITATDILIGLIEKQKVIELKRGIEFKVRSNVFM